MDKKTVSLLIFSLISIFGLSDSFASIFSGGIENDSQTSIIYDSTTGELAVDAPLFDLLPRNLSSIDIKSTDSIFTGDPALNLGGAFDVDSDSQIFKLDTTSGFWDITFGNVAVTGLSESFILGDLTVNGSFTLGGGLGNVDLIYIPEVPIPQPVYLLGAGMGILTVIRKKLKLYTPYS